MNDHRFYGIDFTSWPSTKKPLTCAIASRFRGVSRPAISRHLRVLKECGVVVSFRHGKTHRYALNPEPIRQIREGWLKGFSRMQTQSLARLRATIEAP
ncbi:MAG: helix-turn-helix domain-containing protein [Pseudomonadales bacterium]